MPHKHLVYSVWISHHDGDQVEVFATYMAALHAVATFAREHWDTLVRYEGDIDEVPPKDDLEAQHLYFNRAGTWWFAKERMKVRVTDLTFEEDSCPPSSST